MRMRPKKNSKERMEKVSFLLAKTDENGTVDIMSSFEDRVKEIANKRLLLEIGCGKGAFATGLSRQNSDALIIAVEIVDDVLMMAMEKAAREECGNIAFLNENAERADIFMPEKSVDRLYLNFSDPWPKKRHAKRRLTSPLFLERYKKILKDGGRIFLKTDNIGLFEYSVEMLGEAGFTLENVCYDLHSSPLNEANILTEYENSFSSKGYKINYLEAFLY